jgi:uncharacterized protein YaiE (UPF0345 family)
MKCTAEGSDGSLFKNEPHAILRSIADGLGWRVMQRGARTFTIYDPETMVCVSLKSFDKKTGAIDSWIWMMVGEVRHIKATCQVHLGEHPYFIQVSIEDAAANLSRLFPLMAPFLGIEKKISAKLRDDALIVRSSIYDRSHWFTVWMRISIDGEGPLYEIDRVKTRSEGVAIDEFKRRCST